MPKTATEQDSKTFSHLVRVRGLTYLSAEVSPSKPVRLSPWHTEPAEGEHAFVVAIAAGNASEPVTLPYYIPAGALLDYDSFVTFVLASLGRGFRCRTVDEAPDAYRARFAWRLQVLRALEAGNTET